MSNRLARVQGFLFRAAFLRRVPTFFRLIFENVLLCFLQSTLNSTAKYITGTLSLRFRKILTKLIHDHYFQVFINALSVYHCNSAILLYIMFQLHIVSEKEKKKKKLLGQIWAPPPSEGVIQFSLLCLCLLLSFELKSCPTCKEAILLFSWKGRWQRSYATLFIHILGLCTFSFFKEDFGYLDISYPFWDNQLVTSLVCW